MFLTRWLRERAGDAILAVAAVACGVAMLIAAERLPEVATFRDVGPAFFPEIIGWGFVVSGVLMLAVARPKRPVAVPAMAAPGAAVPAAEGTVSDDTDGPAPKLDHPWPRFGAAVVVTIAYAYLLPRFGFPWTTIPFVFALGIVFGSRRIVVNAATAAFATAFLVLVFRVWLRVPLPM